MEKDYLIITLEECYSAYQKLGLSKKGNGPSQKDTNEELLAKIKLILGEHDVIVHTQPNEKAAFKLWQLEFKRMTAAFSRMKQCLHSRKVIGVFYDSRKYSTFATKQQAVSPEKEVI